jgi:Arm DNA-binding domain
MSSLSVPYCIASFVSAQLTAALKDVTMKSKLTDTGIRSYQPRAAQYAIGDSACPGLCIRITPAGVKTFAFAYRDKATGKVIWLTLGRYPDVPLAQAREIANDSRKIITAGGTPLTPQMLRTEAQKKRRPMPRWSNSISTLG